MSANPLEAVRAVALPAARGHEDVVVNDKVRGVLCAVAAATIMSLAISFSRLAVKTSLAPADLLALRFGIGGLLFLPFLVWSWRKLPAVARKNAIPLSFSHGWGMAGCSLVGISLAPASHAAALGPGFVPLFIAALSPFVLGRRISKQQGIGLVAILLGGTALFLQASVGVADTAILGDALFLAAAFLAACYLLFVERSQIASLAGNAIVMVFSALVVVPIYLVAFDSRIPGAPMSDVLLQGFFQGVLMSAAYLLTHFAVLKIGGARVSMVMASIPVMTLLVAHSVAGDAIRPLEVFAVAAISIGIFYGALLKLRHGNGGR